MTAASIAHLPRAQRVAHLQRKARKAATWTALTAVSVLMSWGQWMAAMPVIFFAISLILTGAALFALHVEMSGKSRAEAEERFYRAHPDNRRGYGPDVAAAAGFVAADTLTALHRTNTHPVSFVVLLTNLSGAAAGMAAFASTQDANGTLATRKLPEMAIQRVAAGFPPLPAGRDWRAVVISARPGEPVKVQPLDGVQAGSFATEAAIFSDPEVFRRFHY